MFRLTKVEKLERYLSGDKSIDDKDKIIEISDAAASDLSHKQQIELLTLCFNRKNANIDLSACKEALLQSISEELKLFTNAFLNVQKYQYQQKANISFASLGEYDPIVHYVDLFNLGR